MISSSRHFGYFSLRYASGSLCWLLLLSTSTQCVLRCAHWRALCPWHSLLFCDNPPFKLHLCLVAIIFCLVILIFWHYTFFWFKWHFLEMCISAGYVSTIFSVNKDLCTLVMQHSEMLSFVRGCILVCHLFLNQCLIWMPDIFTCLFPSTFSSLSSSFWQSTFGEKQKRTYFLL